MLFKISQTIKLLVLIVSQTIQTIVLIWWDGYSVTNTYSEMKKVKTNKKQKAIGYLERLYKR